MYIFKFSQLFVEIAERYTAIAACLGDLGFKLFSDSSTGFAGFKAVDFAVSHAAAVLVSIAFLYANIALATIVFFPGGSDYL